MFADSLLNNNWDNRSHRGWTTLASFALQALCVGIMLLLPFLHTEGLPQLQLMGTIAAPGPPPPPPPPPGPRSLSTSNESNLMGNHLVQISQIPRAIQNIVETEPPPTTEVFGTGVPGGTGAPASNGPVLNSLGFSNLAATPVLRPSGPPPRVSRMMEGSLIYKVQPSYPELAKATRVHGQVVLRAVISRRGTIESLQVVSGHPLLAKAAIDAVQEWRYRPYVLNGDPVEVETEITVNFVLSGG